MNCPYCAATTTKRAKQKQMRVKQEQERIKLAQSKRAREEYAFYNRQSPSRKGPPVSSRESPYRTRKLPPPPDELLVRSLWKDTPTQIQYQLYQNCKVYQACYCLARSFIMRITAN